MPDADSLTPEERDALAGELAFGLLEGEERAVALRLALADRDFAARVEQWRDFAADLYDEVAPVAAPPSAWVSIAAQTMPVANDVAAPPASALRRWRAGAIGAGAAAAVLAIMLLTRPAPPVDQPGASTFAVAQLSGPIEGLRIATRYDPDRATMHVRASGMPATPTEPELWIVPADGVPRSLGQIRREGETLILVAEGHRRLINAGAQLQLSMEPPSDTPSAAPTAPMVATGAIDLL